MKVQSRSLCLILMLVLGTLNLPLCQADEQFGGTYHIPAGAGPALDLTLQQDAAGNATGTLSNAQMTFQVEGKMLQEGEAKGKMIAGTLHNEQATMFFAAQKHPDGRIEFVFIQPNAEGKPDLTKTNTVIFPAAGGAPGGGNGDAAGANPTGVAPTDAVPGGNAGGAYAGIFKSADMTIESRNAAGHYVGTISFNGQTFKFTGQPQGDGLEGTFENKDDKFPFTASLNGNTLTFVTAGTTYQLAKQNPKPATNPLAKPQSAKPQSANPLAKPPAHNPLAKPSGTSPTAITKPANPVVHTASWKTYKHPAGLSMRYPAEWTLKEMPGMLQLVPPDTAANAAGPTEAYLVSAQQVGNITSAQDPRFIQAIELIVSKLFPFMQRVGDMEQVRAGNEPGVALQWEGKNPTGMTVHAQVFATVLKGFGVSVFAVGDKNRVAARDKITRGIFTSFGAFEGEKDPQLVGHWQSGVADNGMMIKDAAGRVSTTSASDSSTRYTFSPDGTVAKVSHSRTIVNAPGVSLDTGDSYETTKGTWAAGGGKLVVFWENGNANEWTYEVVAEPGQSRRVRLHAGQGGMVLGEING
ncbi:MAG: hypothetical protein JO316_23625 [Abitibacteriaceae bacterium]|nr:hypothetical protein [Abditibacteriaceae bacterium]